MEKSKKEQAEKLQIKLDKLLQTRDKKQQAFDKAKKELATVTKNIDTVKLKIFEILQNGSDDTAFSNWAKRKINENTNSPNPQKPTTQNHETNAGHNHQRHTEQNPNQRQ